MINKSIVIAMLGVAPALALAGGNHGGDHSMTGHDEPKMHSADHRTDTGKPGDPAKVTRTIEIGMDDTMRFVPGDIKVKAGETIRFSTKNRGKLPHEMVIGSIAELNEHAEMMRKMPGMEHDEPNMIALPPGDSGELIWHFDQPGEVDFACLIPGHMGAGMVGKVVVTK